MRTTGPRRLVILAVVAIAGCVAPATSGPPGSPRVSCLGVPAEKCDEAVASVARSLPNTAPVSIEVSCVSGTCTPESGAMDTVVTLADGSQLRSSTNTWSNGQAPANVGPAPVPVPPPAVEPVCQGVPASMCRTMAESTPADDPGHGAVIQIVVRCTKPPCTDENGEGDTVTTFADGTTQTSGWGYAVGGSD